MPQDTALDAREWSNVLGDVPLFASLSRRHLNKVALQLAEPMSTIVYAVYFAVPHLELFDVRDLVVHNWDPINWLVCGGATLYAAAYAVFFLFATWLVFRRQPLA